MLSDSILRCIVIYLFSLFFSLSIPVCSRAETDTRYVSDQLVVRLKSAFQPPYNTVATVKTGEILTIVEERDKAAKVLTQEGDEGWIDKKYITSELPKDLIITNLQTELKELKNLMSGPAVKIENQHEETARLNLRIEALSQQIKSINAQNTQLKQRNEELSLQLEKNLNLNTSSDLIEDDNRLAELERLSTERDALLMKFKDLESENNNLKRSLQNQQSSSASPNRDDSSSLSAKIKLLSQENQRLKKDKRLYWFLAGSLVFFFGLTTGMLSSKKKRRLTY